MEKRSRVKIRMIRKVMFIIRSGARVPWTLKLLLSSGKGGRFGKGGKFQG